MNSLFRAERGEKVWEIGNNPDFKARFFSLIPNESLEQHLGHLCLLFFILVVSGDQTRKMESEEREHFSGSWK